MGCEACDKKRKAMAGSNYYSSNFGSSTSTNTPVTQKRVIEQKKECKITYKMLVQAYQDINKNKELPTEIKDSMRLQVAEWVSTIKSTCPDEAKFKTIRDKLDGTDSSTDKQE